MTKRSSIRKTALSLIAATALAGLSGGAIAAAADDDRLDAAWEDLTADQEGILTASQFAKLNNPAFQAAATKICEGYELDQVKFAQGLNEATATGPEDMSEIDAKRWEAAVLFRLGASYGIFLAEGNAKSDDFCKSAAEFKADADSTNVWK
ncbi:MAG: hypothetical protein F9K43_23780 [Bauldia sp.]|nr:MAG: hypothetical protein F9K43_23780 [Bauldia sp.]